MMVCHWVFIVLRKVVRARLCFCADTMCVRSFQCTVVSKCLCAAFDGGSLDLGLLADALDVALVDLLLDGLDSLVGKSLVLKHWEMVSKCSDPRLAGFDLQKASSSRVRL